MTAVVRQACGQALSLPPLPAAVAVTGPESDAEIVAAEFAEQFSVDVSVIGAERRSGLLSTFAERSLGVAVQTYLADFVPRVWAGLAALGIERAQDPMVWDHTTDPSDQLFNHFLPGVARLRELDALTSEVVRLRGAAQHNCRLCKSLRETTALDAGGSETLYRDIEHFETSSMLTDRQKAALRYVDALIWSPARIPAEVADGVRAHFSDTEAVELTLDVMRNASNKIAVALGGDAPQVEHGTQQYLLGADGQTVFT